MNRKGIRGFFRSSMKNRIVILMVLIAIVPFSIIYTYVFFNLKSSMTAEYVSGARESIYRFSELMDRKLLEYVQKSKYISADRNMVENLGRDFGDSIELKADFYVRASRLLEDVGIFQDSDWSEYSIYYSNPSLFDYKYFKDISNIGDSSFIRDKVMKASASDILWSPEVFTDSLGGRHFSLYARIPVASSEICILEVDIPFSVMEFYLKSMDIPAGSVMIYRDASDRSFTVSGPQNTDGTESGGLGENSRYITLESSFINSHTLEVLIPESGISNKYRGVLTAMLGVFLLAILSISLVAVWTSNSITRELKRFISQIKKEDDILLNNITLEIAGDDEVSVIKRKFGKLLEKINALHSENLETYKNQKVLEMELLRSKLNPHMLYNSLSVIKWGAISNSDTNMVELVNCLTKYYRSVLNKGNNIIQIKEEIKLVREYVRINEIAHAASYGLQVDLEEGVSGYYILRLLLQPIVENAISHGLNGKPGEKKIVITGARSGGDILLAVEDNGYGMSPEVIEKVLAMNYKKPIGGYGIKNIISMMKTYFGEGYGIEIESRQGSFTRVSLKIPVHENPGTLREPEG